MNTILAPIDFSETARVVVAEAAKLARAVDGRLVVLHVIPPLPASTTEFGFAEAAAKIAAAAEEDAENRLTLIREQLNERGLDATTLHVPGVPGTAIVRRAREYRANYIVIGSHGHGAFYDLIVGSTARRVMKEATCPVLVVPSGTAPSPDALSLNLEPAETSAA